MIGIILAFASMLIWGLSDLVTKISLNKESNWKVLFFGQFFGGLAVFFIALGFVDFSSINLSKLYYLPLFGLANFIGMYTFYKSMQVKGVSLTAPIINSWAFITVILGAIFYHETLGFLHSSAILLILLGLFFITSVNLKKFKFDSSFAFAIFSMVLWGVFYFLLKIPNIIFGALLVTSTVKIITSFFTIPVLFRKKINLFDTNKKSLFVMLLVGLTDAFGFLALNFAYNYSPVSIVATIGSAVPVVSVLLGVLVLKEKLNLRQLSGIVIVIAGLILISL